jgi:small subunit ribosomal protein S21|tara:strand:+ start:1174 stop:1368 length:195 start_codon:yes stop_codon:yes gene_type:complete
MLIVKIRKNENINQALKRFKRKFRDTGVVKEIRKRKEFIKPSALKRKQKLKAIHKAKFLAKNED